MLDWRNQAVRRGTFHLAALALSLTACTSQASKVDLASDCIGRMQLDLPKNAEVAHTSNGYLEMNLDMAPPNSRHRKISFSDGQEAGFSIFHVGGELLISEPQSPQRLDQFLDALVGRHLTRVRKDFNGRRLPSGGPYVLDVVDTGSSSARAYRFYGNAYSIAAKVGDRLVTGTFSARPDSSEAESLGQLKTFIRSTRARSANEVPSSHGLCLPFVFVADEGQSWREVGASYRPQAYPDIEVTFRDRTASRTEPGVRTRNAEPEPAMVSIWSQHLTKFKEVKPLWSPSTRSVRLAGYSGLASFMQLTRDDGSVEYGYLAIVRGNPDAKEDTPDLMVYMIRNAERARAKGQEPIGKDAFIEMAETIAGSVRRRPVQ